MSTLLASQGIAVKTPYDAAHLEPAPDLIIVGNAISRGNPEAEAVLARGLPHLSMPQAIERFFLQDKIPLVVAGTHGKTTTAAMLAWVLESAGKDPGFFLGGIPKNFAGNFKLGEGKFFVLEGDEYDTAFFDKGPKFLHYRPRCVLLTSIEFDHADIYRDLEHVKESFRKLLRLIPSDGWLAANLDFPAVQELLSEYRGQLRTYAMQEKNRSRADFFGEILSDGELCSFCVLSREEGEECCHREVSWNLPGRHNASNALGLIALASQLGLSWEEIRHGLLTFQGVRRRQDVLGEIGGITVIDDFAHHPTAVRETVEAIRRRYPARRLWAVFEPRSNSSKRDVFQEEYPQGFMAADLVLIADVFMPEKVKDGKILNVERIVEEINRTSGASKARHISGIDRMAAALVQEARSGDVLLFMSNGGFGGIQQKVLEDLTLKRRGQ
jgi:UDP-N-acetylmuramate: L-alanyl-gamma-D-glutamyl-meso-diaminopimelate ligase